MADADKDKELLLTQITELVGKDIVKNLDLKSRLSFRQTCQLHQKLVDNGVFCIEKLLLSIAPRYLKIVSSDGFDVKFRQNKKTTVEDEDGELVPAEVAFWYEWAEATVLILSSNREQIIKKLVVMVYDAEDVATLAMHAETALNENIFSILEHPPKVESLHIHLPEFECLGNVLPYLDSTVIKDISIDFYYSAQSDEQETRDSEEYLEEIEAVHQLDQWKNAKSFRSKLCTRGEHILSFAHFDLAKFRIVNAPPVEKIMEFKEKLLLNQNLNQVHITINLKPEVFQKINNLIETYNFIGTPNPVWATFKYPNSQKTMSMCVMDTWIGFKGPCFEEDVEPVHDWDFDDDEEDPIENKGRNGVDEEDDNESGEEDGGDDEVDDKKQIEGEKEEEDEDEDEEESDDEDSDEEEQEEKEEEEKKDKAKKPRIRIRAPYTTQQRNY